MSPSTEQLIQQLSGELTPVEVLPAIPRTAVAGILLAVGVAGAASLLAMSLGVYGAAPQRPGAWLSVSSHGLLALGALAGALGACVPGRGRLERAGLCMAATGLAATLAMAAAIVVASPPQAVAGLSRGVLCLGLTLVPTLLPAYFVLRFTARGVPRHPRLCAALAVTAVAAVVALPGHMGCGISDPVHTVCAHVLAPVIAGLIVLLFMQGVRPNRTRAERSSEG